MRDFTDGRELVFRGEMGVSFDTLVFCVRAVGIGGHHLISLFFWVPRIGLSMSGVVGVGCCC